MKKTKWLAPAFALALAASALFASHIPASLAQQGQQDPRSSRKPACGCYVCGNVPGAVMFEDKDCVGILAADACGERLADLPKEKREGFCQKIKAQVRFTSFKDSCPVYAPYCGPEKTAAQDPARGGAAGPTQTDNSSGSKGSTAQKGKQSKSSRGGLDSIKPGEIPPVTASTEPSTAGAVRGRPPTSSTTQAVPLPLTALQVSPNPVAGGNRVQGTVELNQLPPNGLTVTLESSNPQLAGVPPSVTITQGTASAETGPMVKATFPIDTRAVNQDTTVIIKARAGVQTLQANLQIRRPVMQSASLDPPNICDGSNKATVKYTLTGPAPSGGLKVYARATVYYPGGAGTNEGESETVPTGNSAGSMRISLARCREGSERCTIRGSAGAEGGAPVSLGERTCGPPPN